MAWLLMNGDRKILVDTGIFGPSDTSDRIGVFSRTPKQELKTQMNRFNTSPEEIGLVINTHLHADHAGRQRVLPRDTDHRSEEGDGIRKTPSPCY